MPVTDYTTYADIRSALGVSTDELEDVTLALQLYEDGLVADLEEVSVTLPEVYATVEALSSPTAAQLRFLRAARGFATYSVARHLTVSLPQFSPQKIEDGKAAMSRVGDPQRKMIEAVHAEYEKWRKRLIAAFEAIGSSAEAAVPRVYFAIVSPGSDPITGT